MKTSHKSDELKIKKKRGTYDKNMTNVNLQYNKLYLKSENIKHYNTSSNELLNQT